MQTADRPAAGASERGSGGDDAQAEYYLMVLAARWQELETEVAERCNELRGLPIPARKSERARNLRRIIRVKQNEIAKVRDLCGSLAGRLHSG
ncbi:hypothetical protein Mycch_0765 [Mycolicibacterium chubuense NBB4]|uniref:Uncharacterized protein n=1 Tax=Mycolicibacterium chubuense (strain NBB4) TaxID=710421 RepID=I4BE75_MYCCN|nr:hypothetical protein [Mycolicibacterium chubuense]AFM15582.1 hypothetical protein Mycch_0765 [Mycolicibacterium chubuense NBB4]